MPLLPSEPFLYPDDLLAEPDGPGAGPWWVLHARPRAEKALARKFLGAGLDFFLPLCHKQWRNRGRLFTSYLPLFPGYLFLRGDGEARLRALETNQVAHVLPVPDPEGLRTDLARVYRLMLADLQMTPEERLQPGTRVEIVSGPLAGLEGTVLRRGRALHFVVDVRFLKQGVSVEVEGWMLRPVGRAGLAGAAGR